MQSIDNRIEAAIAFIREKTECEPGIGLILGSGLGDFVKEIANPAVMQFSEIPGFPVPSVEGHAGALVMGEYHGRKVAGLSGRVHYYEGISQQEATIPVRVLKLLGVKSLILTNAAGGINSSFSAGALMVISDHINYSGYNPLIGRNLDEFGSRFPDMTEIYTASLRQELISRAADIGVSLKEGIYAMYSGPSYETPAEIRMIRGFGADAVGMSTVPEAIVARHSGMNVIGISCITNMAAGLSGKPLNHKEVVEVADRVKSDFKKVVSLAIDLC